MEQICQVVMLPTEKASFLFYCDVPIHQDKLIFAEDHARTKEDGPFKPQHIYFTTDEKILPGDYGMGFATGIKGIGKGHFIFKHDDTPKARLGAICVGARKIVATTDQTLAVDKGHLCLDYLPWIPDSFTEAYAAAKGEVKEVTIDYKEFPVNACKACNNLGVAHCAHPEECGEIKIGKTAKLNEDNTVIIYWK